MLKRLTYASDNGPANSEFDLRRHLNGPLKSEGVIFGPTGRLVSQFVADMEGVWSGEKGELREEFRFASGVIEKRVWKISIGTNGTYTATAADIVGVAKGRLDGTTAQSLYKIQLGPETGNHIVSANDWMYLSENGVILNQSRFRKFGVKVGELVATIRPA